MIDVLTENLISPQEAAKLPVFRSRTGKPAHISKVYRAMTPGCKGVRLESIQTPGGLRTSTEAISRFIAELNDQADPIPPAGYRRSHQDAEQRLAAAGI